ncbi:hypothetical protein B296_00028217 [Ensete ventricosum]|uniref:Uncharacterized protein n=1 Tax=Ensete ventricosum TaxID=4639 RepID=A0A426XXI1_ENSVE|nr:hypothetical protein B296_00028217 [Ensete ventricosum]
MFPNRRLLSRVGPLMTAYTSTVESLGRNAFVVCPLPTLHAKPLRNGAELSVWRPVGGATENELFCLLRYQKKAFFSIGVECRWDFILIEDFLQLFLLQKGSLCLSLLNNNTSPSLRFVAYSASLQPTVPRATFSCLRSAREHGMTTVEWGPKAAAVDRGPDPSHIENPRSKQASSFHVTAYVTSGTNGREPHLGRPPAGARDAKRACTAYVAPRQRVD